MYDLEQIGKIIADLERYFQDLEDYTIRDSNMTTEQFYGVSMLLFAMLNRTIDLGKEIICGRKRGMPTSYKEIFQILEKERLISEGLSQELQWLAGQRNVLAHEYFDVTKKSIYLVYTKRKAMKDFMERGRKLVVERKNNGKSGKQIK